MTLFIAAHNAETAIYLQTNSTLTISPPSLLPPIQASPISLSLAAPSHPLHIYSTMGATHSRPVPKYTSRKYDWEKEAGAYVPYRHQRKQKQWREEEHEARIEDRRAREIARARKRHEREMAREKRYEPINAQKQSFRRQYDEYMAAKYQ